MTKTESKDRRASDILYDEISASRNSIRRENIRLIKNVCEQMEKDGIQISVAEVVRRCGPDGPAYSTVSNIGSKLGDFVKLRIDEQVSFVKSNSAHRSLSDSVIDPVLQAQIRDKESTARWLQKENSALRSLLKSLRPGVDIDGAIANATKGAQMLVLGPSDQSCDASNETLANCLLKLMDHLVGSRQYTFDKGRLLVNKKVVLDAHQTAAFSAATKLSSTDWSARYQHNGGADGKR